MEVNFVEHTNAGQTRLLPLPCGSEGGEGGGGLLIMASFSYHFVTWPLRQTLQLILQYSQKMGDKSCFFSPYSSVGVMAERIFFCVSLLALEVNM